MDLQLLTQIFIWITDPNLIRDPSDLPYKFQLKYNMTDNIFLHFVTAKMMSRF